MKDSAVEEIKSRLNIVDVVSTYIKIEKSGSQFKARCPFHGEKTPSFYISPSKGYFHCFGCAVHGDIFTFVTKIENLEFKDALKTLADRAGVSLNRFKKEENSVAYDILEAATRFFQNNLENNFEAKNYILNRGLSQDTINSFRIGFASNEWRELYSYLRKNNFIDEDIEKSGLCIKHEKGFYDRFRSRVMFPICNTTGKVVAFTGRIIGEEAKKEGVAKYVNSPETQVYHKSSVLYAYDKAKNFLNQEKKIILVEGQMDTVMSHQAGVKNVVAISGTALTTEHVKILNRFTDTVCLALDTDKAGYTALLRSAQAAYFQDMFVEVLTLGDAKDPADIVLNNPEDWRTIVSRPVNFFTYIANIIKDNEAGATEILKKIRTDVLPVLKMVKSNIARDIYAKEIAEVLNINYTNLLNDIKSSDIALPENSIKNIVKVKQDKDVSEIYSDLLIYNEIISQKSQINFTEKIQNIINLLTSNSVAIDKKEGYYEFQYIKIEKDIENNIAQIQDENILKITYEEMLNSAYNKFIQLAAKMTDDLELINKILKSR